jgi:RNA polymerase sigma-70 factor, ECF subfamily
MTCDNKAENERARRFRDVALPCLDDVYTLAYFLMRNRTDAEDAVQECYLRALHHFDSRHGSAIKPWLLTILRNVCHAEFARRGRRKTPTDLADCENHSNQSFWLQPQASPDSELLDRQEDAAIRQLVACLPAQFREVIVLREFSDMTYREIAEVAGVPLGTVMSRLARARAMLLSGWKTREGTAQEQSARLPQRVSEVSQGF